MLFAHGMWMLLIVNFFLICKFTNIFQKKWVTDFVHGNWHWRE